MCSFDQYTLVLASSEILDPGSRPRKPRLRGNEDN
jgi:hypothetical protein